MAEELASAVAAEAASLARAETQESLRLAVILGHFTEPMAVAAVAFSVTALTAKMVKVKAETAEFL
jgi:hypothetical protein